MAWACLPTSGTGSFLFTDDITADTRMNPEVYRAILCSQVQPNVSKHTGQCFTMQMNNGPNHTLKGAQCKEVECVLQSPRQITWPESNQACISLAEGKSEIATPRTSRKTATAKA